MRNSWDQKADLARVQDQFSWGSAAGASDETRQYAAEVVRAVSMENLGLPMWYTARDCLLLGYMLGFLDASRHSVLKLPEGGA